LGGITWIQGREVELKNIIGSDGKNMRLKGREIIRTQTEKAGDKTILVNVTTVMI
jgi:hypothetical protein